MSADRGLQKRRIEAKHLHRAEQQSFWVCSTKSLDKVLPLSKYNSTKLHTFPYQALQFFGKCRLNFIYSLIYYWICGGFVQFSSAAATLILELISSFLCCQNILFYGTFNYFFLHKNYRLAKEEGVVFF